MGHVERRLPALLQAIHQFHLKRLQPRDVFREFLAVKTHLTVAPLAHVGQLPLPRGLRNLPADIAVRLTDLMLFLHLTTYLPRSHTTHRAATVPFLSRHR